MAIKSKSLTQAEVFANKLKELSRDITKEDRLGAIKELKVSKSTLSIYLSGTVHSNDTAADLIAFFQNRIQMRYQKVQ